MKILGIDYGKAKVGLAIGGGFLAEPLQVIRYKDIKVLQQQIKQIVEYENIEKIIVGISEGEMGRESRDFGISLGKFLTIPVEIFDETLSTRDAQELSRQAGINRKKRKEMEDAFAASVMLQSYLDNNV